MRFRQPVLVRCIHFSLAILANLSAGNVTAFDQVDALPCTASAASSKSFAPYPMDRPSSAGRGRIFKRAWLRFPQRDEPRWVTGIHSFQQCSALRSWTLGELQVLKWVNSAGLTARRSLPVFPDRRTLPTGRVGSETCQQRIRRCRSVASPRWPILNLGMLFSAKCSVRINLRAMVWPISL